jgi:signal transduction histidine kinase
MIATVVGVATLAWWDAVRESSAALDDFGTEQATLAQSVAQDLEHRLAAQPTTTALHPASQLPSFDSAIVKPGVRILLLQRPQETELVDPGGARFASPAIQQAIERGETMVRLSRPEALALGLPERMAVAGLATVPAGSSGHWGVAVVTTALRERDRERWAQRRLILAVAIATSLVLAFGGFALRNQRNELELSHRLALTEIARERDERLERLSQAATMLTLASGMAHELSTPLGVIIGRAEQLSPRLVGDERATRSLQAIIEQAERIREVVRGFLSLARGGAPTLHNAEPAAIVRDALTLVEHRFEKAAVSLVPTIPDGLPPVPCDPRLLAQALVNLLLNACDACARGGRVVVQVQAVDTGVEFSVTDDGAGIAVHDAARVTEPFFTTKATGTGLGLAVTNEIVKTHRGTLHIGPSQPRGTRAAFQVPGAAGAKHA